MVGGARGGAPLQAARAPAQRFVRHLAALLATLAWATAGGAEGQPLRHFQAAQLQEAPEPSARQLQDNNLSSSQPVNGSSSCRPACPDGYRLVAAEADPQPMAVCTDGNVSLDVGSQCEPSPCNVTAALALSGLHEISLGDCPEILNSSGSCVHECPVAQRPKQRPVSNASCWLGNFTFVTCESFCEPGYEVVSTDNGTICAPCAHGFYKEGMSQGPCEACPEGSNTSLPGANSTAYCICSNAMFANRTEQGVLLNCASCPENSLVVGSEGRSLEDCLCIEDHLREPPDTGQPLQYCRLPYGCDLDLFLRTMNYTGPEPFQLKEGTCKNYIDDGNGTMVMQHLDFCYLRCEQGRNTQVGSSFFFAIPTEILCHDGEIVEYPPQGTWCSEEAWVIPPLIFLGVVTAATGGAGLLIEFRQSAFEQSYEKALAINWAATSPAAKKNQ